MGNKFMRSFWLPALLALIVAFPGCVEEEPPAPTYEVSAWVPWTHLSSVKSSLLSELDTIDTAHLFWYELESDGTIKERSYADPELVSTLKSSKVKVIPTITDAFTKGRAHGVMSSASKRAVCIASIVTLVETKGYDGIDLDWESMASSDRDLFSSFVTDLAAELHAESKLLSVAVYAKTSAPGSWSGPKSHDYAKLGAAVDRLNIMGYGYGYSSGPPRALGPVHWLKRILDFTTSVVDPSKIYLGIPFYARDWPAGKSGKALTHKGVKALLAKYKPLVTYDPEDGESSFSYTDSAGAKHTVWFQSPEGVSDKMSLVVSYGLGGTAIWRLGDEDPKIWDAIRSKLKPEK